MAISADIVFIWPGTAATIPTGFTRETSLDSKYAVGAASGADGGSSVGASTHSSHPQPASHFHNVSGGAGSSGGNRNAGVTGTAVTTHTHASARSATAQPAVGASSNEHKHYEVIWIKSSGTHDIGVDSVAFFDADPTDTDWKFCDGSESTTDLRNRFLKGAAASSDPGSGSATGVESHTHDLSHSHSAANSARPTGTSSSAGSTIEAATSTHVHSVSLDNASFASATGAGEYPWIQWRPYQNKGAGAKQTIGMIGAWLSTVASIPANWSRVSAGDGKLIRTCNVTGDTGTTGGALTHVHVFLSGGTHVYTATAGNGASVLVDQDTPVASQATSGHTHAWTVATATIANLDANTSGDTLPPSLTAIWIKCAAIASDALTTRTLLGAGA